MASPLLSERVCSAILRSLCADEGKMHEKAVVACLEKQRLIINIAGEEAIFSFADAVDVANYDARGMMDDFFRRYPYKTTRNSWKFFKVWVTDGIGQLYKEFCEEWIELAQKFLRECSSCRACSRKPTTEQLLQVFGTARPYYIGERPRRMYLDDDQMLLSSELYPVAGGLVAEGNRPEVKEEIQDAPPGFAYPLTRGENGGPSGVKSAQAVETQLMAQR
ncbi:hypothetical protein AQUCO_01600073v1 [Aquilegia coerulea]|uniref:Uncharacterized protein n=1 Tax=Aquilegia coerulea TaxID=218851 RepID=A0A2G5DQ88_AQUCA|nr:hypothetical protein AQUCO_01600073v1 [Aquilegia coerulea]